MSDLSFIIKSKSGSLSATGRMELPLLSVIKSFCSEEHVADKGDYGHQYNEEYCVRNDL